MLAEVIQAAVVRLALVQSDLDPTSHPGVRGPVDHEQGSVRRATDVHHRARRAAGTWWPGRPGSARRRARRRPRRRSRSEIRDPDPAALMAQMAVVLNGPGGRCGFAGGVRRRVAAGDDDVLAVAQVDVGPAQGRHLAPAQRTVEEQPHDRAVDQAAALGRLLPLEAAAGPLPLPSAPGSVRGGRRRLRCRGSCRGPGE